MTAARAGTAAVTRTFPGSRFAWSGIHHPPCPGCGSRRATMLRSGDSRALCARCQPRGLSRRSVLERRARPTTSAAPGDLLPM